MKKVAFVRGAFLNNFEGQNFRFEKNDIGLLAFSSLYPLDTNVPFSVTKLRSIVDLNHLPFLRFFPLYQRSIKYISNRLIGDSQILFGLEKKVNGYDVVDTADPHYYYSYQLAKMRQKKQIKKLLVTYCEIIPFNNESVYQKKKNKYFTISQADAFICHTKLSRDTLVLEGANPDKISIVHLGVDLQRFAPVRREISNDITLLFVGRLVPEKGIKELYKAFTIIRGNVKQKIVLQIIGEGPLESWLKMKIKQDDLENYIKIKKISYDQIHKAYQAADIFVLPSQPTKTIAEQYGMVLIEAMACGLPVVASNIGAIPEVVGEAGIVTDTSNIENLSNKLDQLISDRKMRENLSAKALQRATEMFDCRKTAATIGTIYSRL